MNMNYFASSVMGSENSHRIGESLVVALVTFVLIIAAIIILHLIAKSTLEKEKKSIIESEPELFKKIKSNSSKAIMSLDDYKSLIATLGFNRRIECSSVVVSNSRNDPVKYVIKYSSVDYSVDSLERLDYLKSIISLYESLVPMWENVGRNYRKKLPLFLHPFISREMVTEILCDNYRRLRRFYFPYLIFSYTSPAGRSQREYRVSFSSSLIGSILCDVSAAINKKGHAKRQRGAMTADLREAIKQRDNYTCQMCGNSVLKEPNLLLEVDHIIPVSEGGESSADNLQTLCWRCNRIKGKKTISDK